MSTQRQPALQVGVVGAGIAGLSAAIALRRLGYAVEIYERSQFRNENGAAVSITPNGGRILEHWGFDSVKAGGIDNIQVRKPKGDTLEPMAPTLSFADVQEKYGAKWLLYHRVDMHRVLREMAEAHGASIKLGCQVMDIDPENGTIVFKDYSTTQKDLIVVADGQHDRLNARITGKTVPMERSGQTAYRCLIPMKDILDDEITRPLFADEAPGFWAPALPAKGVMCVTYPCRDNNILNVIAVHRKLGQHVLKEEDVAIEDWNFPATHEDLEQVLDGFHPSVKRVFLKAPDVKVYSQMKRQPLNCMTKGKAVLIGDACHPMLLTHAQGTSSSFEDAAALEVFLADVPASQSVSAPPSEQLLARLQQFEKFRLPRVSATQILTEPIVPGPKFMELSKKQEDLIRQYYSGPLPQTGSMPHSPAICQFFFGYDVRKEATQFLEENPLPEVPSVTALPAPMPSIPTGNAQIVVAEAQKALAAAQIALVQVTQTLVAAQKALDLALAGANQVQLQPQPQPQPQTRPLSALPPFLPPAPPIPQDTTPRPLGPKRLKSFENLRNRMSAALGKKPQAEVKEVQLTPPDTPPSEKHARPMLVAEA